MSEGTRRLGCDIRARGDLCLFRRVTGDILGVSGGTNVQGISWSCRDIFVQPGQMKSKEG